MGNGDAVPLAILRTRMTLMMVGLMGMRSDFISSRTIPSTERKTMTTSSWFQRSLRYLPRPSADTFMPASRMNTAVKK